MAEPVRENGVLVWKCDATLHAYLEIQRHHWPDKVLMVCSKCGDVRWIKFGVETAEKTTENRDCFTP